jgi:hypothetical protein
MLSKHVHGSPLDILNNEHKIPNKFPGCFDENNIDF